MRMPAAMSLTSRLSRKWCISSVGESPCGAAPGRAEALEAATGAAGWLAAVASWPTHTAGGPVGPLPQVPPDGGQLGSAPAARWRARLGAELPSQERGSFHTRNVETPRVGSALSASEPDVEEVARLGTGESLSWYPGPAGPSNACRRSSRHAGQGPSPGLRIDSASRPGNGSSPLRPIAAAPGGARCSPSGGGSPPGGDGGPPGRGCGPRANLPSATQSLAPRAKASSGGGTGAASATASANCRSARPWGETPLFAAAALPNVVTRVPEMAVAMTAPGWLGSWPRKAAAAGEPKVLCRATKATALAQPRPSRARALAKLAAELAGEQARKIAPSASVYAR